MTVGPGSLGFAPGFTGAGWTLVRHPEPDRRSVEFLNSPRGGHEIAEEHIELLDAATQDLLSSGALTEADRTDLLWLLRRRSRDSVAELLSRAAEALADPESEVGYVEEQPHDRRAAPGDRRPIEEVPLWADLTLVGGSIVALPASAAASFGVMAVGGAAAAVTGMFLPGRVGGIVVLAAGLIVARRNGC